jgi:hypothetical protein
MGTSEWGRLESNSKLVRRFKLIILATTHHGNWTAIEYDVNFFKWWTCEVEFEFDETYHMIY